MSEQPQWSRGTAQLRLFAPEQDTGDARWNAETRIRAYFEQYFLPRRCRKADPKTIAEYRTTLKYFLHCFGNLAVGEISADVLAEFIERLEAMPGKTPGGKMSDATVAKHVRHFECILSSMGPATRKNRIGAGIFVIPPFFPEAYEVSKRHKRKPFTLVEIGRLLDATRIARKPRLLGVTPADWWSGLFRVLYNVGPRIETALALEPGWIAADGKAEVPPEFYKGGELRTLEFNCWALRVIEGLHPPGTARRRTFAGVSAEPGMQFDPRDQVEEGCCRRYLDELFKEIMRAAGVAVLPYRVWHGFRRSFADQLSMLCPSAAQLALGHASLDVTRDHYVDGRVLRSWLDQLPQPVKSRRTLDDRSDAGELGVESEAS